MKPFLKILTIILTTLFVVSCSRSDDNETTPATDYFLKAKVDGVQYTATAVQTNATKIGSGATTTITVNSSVSGKNFKFTLIGIPTIGTYVLDSNSSNGEMSYVETSLNYSTIICPDNSGTLVISSLNTTEIEGTFNFIAKSSSICSDAAKTITEGTFKIKFI